MEVMVTSKEVHIGSWWGKKTLDIIMICELPKGHTVHKPIYSESVVLKFHGVGMLFGKICLKSLYRWRVVIKKRLRNTLLRTTKSWPPSIWALPPCTDCCEEFQWWISRVNQSGGLAPWPAIKDSLVGRITLAAKCSLWGVFEELSLFRENWSICYNEQDFKGELGSYRWRPLVQFYKRKWESTDTNGGLLVVEEPTGEWVIQNVIYPGMPQ